MQCSFCGAENRDDSRFCNNCGKSIDQTMASAMTMMGSLTKTTPGTTSTGTGSGNSRTLTPGAQLQNGRYTITKMLGEGGMGAALLASDLRLDGKPVVIKELLSNNPDATQTQEDVRNFEREMKTLAHIDHPLVPNVTDHFEEGTRYFMVQEYVEGENLEERMDRVNQPMKEREALEYASEILDILDYLEQQKPPIVHRDIKPANIIIGNKDKRAHLVDFGIARADENRNARRKQTSALGTPGYAPPEQYQGNADARSDLYALAATLHHLLTNRDPRNYPPFSYPPVRGLNPPLSTDIERVLNKALNNDVSKRYQNAAEMKREIDGILLKKFGRSGDMSSYTLNPSGPMAAGTGMAAGAMYTGTPQPVPNPPIKPRPQAQPQQQQRQAPPPPVPISRQPARPQPVPSPYQPAGMIGGSARQQKKSNVGRNFLLFIVAIIILALLVSFALPYIHNLASKSSATPVPTQSFAPTATASPGSALTIGAITAPDGEKIGISDGTVAFDTTQPDGAYKSQAEASLLAGDAVTAGTLWRDALATTSNDAEPLIYLEDQRVMHDFTVNGTPYITIVVGTMLSGTNASVGRDDLQGAYLAQREYNAGHKLKGGVEIRLLIANAGSGDKAYAATVAQQIVRLAQSDATVVGVMGWPFSSRTEEAITALQKAHIPMVSETSSDDALSGLSPYFFRVAPPNKVEAIDGAKYAENSLHAKNVALFVDPTDPYSSSLANDFSAQFQADGNSIVAIEKYTVGTTGHAQLPQLLQDALNHNPDLIYFSGYASDLGVIMANLPTSGPYATIKILGGDALYELGGYSASQLTAYSHLRFTSFAFADEWDNLHLTAQKPQFFSDYSSTYGGNHGPGTYFYTRPDGDAILSYDAMLAMLSASNIALQAKTTITGSDLQQALLTINGAQTIQGVSGQIGFDPATGDPVHKAIVVLAVDATGHTQEVTVEGQFLKTP